MFHELSLITNREMAKLLKGTKIFYHMGIFTSKENNKKKFLGIRINDYHLDVEFKNGNFKSVESQKGGPYEYGIGQSVGEQWCKNWEQKKVKGKKILYSCDDCKNWEYVPEGIVITRLPHCKNVDPIEEEVVQRQWGVLG